MSVVGLDDAEADLTAAVRAATGPGTLISAAMDLHGDVSPAPSPPPGPAQPPHGCGSRAS